MSTILPLPLPLPLRASVLLREYLLSKGTSITQSTAQEAVARAHGHKSFQTLQAESKAQQSKEPGGPLSHLEGQELWGISGRCWGADDDSVDQVWAKDLESAKQKFLRESLDLSDEDIEGHKDSDPVYFFITDQLLGKVVKGQFLLNPELIPSAT